MPSPHVTGSAPSKLRQFWLAALAAPTTRAPRAAASWTAVLPIPPEVPLMNSVLPPFTPNWSIARVAVSSATGSAAASTNPSEGE